MTQPGVESEHRQAGNEHDAFATKRRRFFKNKKIKKKEDYQNASTLARAKAERPNGPSQRIDGTANERSRNFPSLKKQQPAAQSEEQGETIRTAGNIIDGCTMNRVHDPKKRYQECDQ